jgi:hypothetical protein
MAMFCRNYPKSLINDQQLDEHLKFGLYLVDLQLCMKNQHLKVDQ